MLGKVVYYTSSLRKVFNKIKDWFKKMKNFEKSLKKYLTNRREYGRITKSPEGNRRATEDP